MAGNYVDGSPHDLRRSGNKIACMMCTLLKRVYYKYYVVAHIWSLGIFSH